jgi:surface protein
MIYLYSSSITIKIKGTGQQRIFYGATCSWGTPGYSAKSPDEVYINNEKKEVNYMQDFIKEENIVKLIWNEAQGKCNCLFMSCSSIIDIDFSNFDFSQDLYANGMFSYCTSLTSINFNGFGKIKLKDGGSMFRDCKSLISLNLTNFNMSQVKDIGGMFYGCHSLTSLDFSSLHNSKTSNTQITFYDCPNLEYINLNNTDFSQTIINNMFSTAKNLVICTQDEKIKDSIKFLGCAIVDCSENWRKNQKKYMKKIILVLIIVH